MWYYVELKCGNGGFFAASLLDVYTIAIYNTYKYKAESVYTTLWCGISEGVCFVVFIYYKREFLWKDKNSVAMKMDGWILHKIAFTGWEDGSVLTHWVEQKKKFFLLFSYYFYTGMTSGHFFLFVWDESNVLMFLLQAWRAQKNFLYYFYGRKHVFVCSLASRNVILIYNKNNFSLFRFITFFNATIKIFLWFLSTFLRFIYFFD